ncbi:CRISPR-associated helicase Cas3' [Ectothiorhodospiraceae bacterium BW-2]|nr:CRISPR-associated helicase Cas3' [Ectothiorhodospiraceae bacterium BW-2]
MTPVIAHYRKIDNSAQLLASHLQSVAQLGAAFGDKIDLAEMAELLGLLHDLGKYSAAFQAYLGSATGQIDPDADGWIDATHQKGKIDHSSAGAQWIWQQWQGYGELGKLAAQMIALCVASHHSGLIDCLTPEGDDNFNKRIQKEESKTHLNEVNAKIDAEIRQRLEQLSDKTVLNAFLTRLQSITQGRPPLQRDFYLGMVTRFLFSALIDADRQDSADFETPENRQFRVKDRPDWPIAIERFEAALQNWSATTPIDTIRQRISDNCYQRANGERGLYTLSVPTGGGKTLASLRFALHHAQQHQMDRIFYIIPYTSIIEQNATAIRELLEQEGDVTPWVLEHHSNLEPEHQTWHSKLSSENWSAPIVLTTMVQFLETLFAGGTRSARRLHQFANSVLIFDEIQTLPVKMVHLFCNALNFLLEQTQTTALLCTATQPLLQGLKHPDKGELKLNPANELAGDVGQLFDDLERIEFIDQRRMGGWQADEIAQLAQQQLREQGSTLVIVNTKGWAKTIYQLCCDGVDQESIYHLSTHQCAAHRKVILTTIKQRLADKLPVLLISTQLIEAGVDIDFASVIRFMAGLDSIAQAAGRCNRHGANPNHRGQVTIINPAEEPLEWLIDIRIGKESADRVMREFAANEWLKPKAISRYFDYYFYQRADEMSYRVDSDSLLSWLSCNDKNSGYQDKPKLQQSFMSAGKAFKAIDAPTEPLLVPYSEGEQIIAELCAVAKDFQPALYRKLLRSAQSYSVNLYANDWRRLSEAGAIYEITAGEGVYYLDSRHYSDEWGINDKAVEAMPFLGV